MANLSKIMLPDGTTYDICDATARASIKGERMWYGTCATGAGTQNKVVTTNSGDFVLEVGSMVRVKFKNAFAYNGTSRLNVDGTGNIDIARVSTTETTRYYVSAGEVIDFVYDGTDFVMSRTGTATTTYYGLAKLATSAASTSTSLALTPQSLNGMAQYMISGVEPFSASKNYEMGDRVRYGYYIYQATSTVSAGAWNSAQWHALDPLLDMIETKADSDDIPTSTSDLTNDSGFITSRSLPHIYVDGESRMIVGYIKTTVSGVEGIKLIYDDGVSPDGVEIFIPDGAGVTSVYQQIISQIPTKTSDLTNDSSFITMLDVHDESANLITLTPDASNSLVTTLSVSEIFNMVASLPDTLFFIPWTQTSGKVFTPVSFNLQAGYVELISFDLSNSEFTVVSMVAENDIMRGYPRTFALPTKTSDLQNDSNFVVDASYVHTDNNFTTALKDSVEALANVGTVYNTSVTDVSVSSGTWKSIASLSLPKGTFLVNGNPRFGAVTNKGTRQMCLNTSSNANGTHGKVVIDFQATSGSGNVIGMQSSYIFSLSSPTTVYLNVYHTQGSALTVSAELQAVCISAGSTSYQSASGVGF